MFAPDRRFLLAGFAAAGLLPAFGASKAVPPRSAIRAPARLHL